MSLGNFTTRLRNTSRAVNINQDINQERLLQSKPTHSKSGTYTATDLHKRKPTHSKSGAHTAADLHIAKDARLFIS